VTKPKLLIIGDFVKHTGFARVNEALAALAAPSWDIAVLGVNYKGDYTPLQQQYRLYPAHLGGELHGAKRLADIVAVEQPDACLFVCDPWIGADYARVLDQLPDAPPSVLYTPVDATGLRRVDVATAGRLRDGDGLHAVWRARVARRRAMMANRWRSSRTASTWICFARSTRPRRERVTGLPLD
jgi:hypothetical protein